MFGRRKLGSSFGFRPIGEKPRRAGAAGAKKRVFERLSRIQKYKLETGKLVRVMVAERQKEGTIRTLKKRRALGLVELLESEIQKNTTLADAVFTEGANAGIASIAGKKDKAELATYSIDLMKTYSSLNERNQELKRQLLAAQKYAKK